MSVPTPSASRASEATDPGKHITEPQPPDSGLWQASRGADWLSAKLISCYAMQLAPLAISHMAPRPGQPAPWLLETQGNAAIEAYTWLGRLRVISPVPCLTYRQKVEEKARQHFLELMLSHLSNNVCKLPFLFLFLTARTKLQQQFSITHIFLLLSMLWNQPLQSLQRADRRQLIFQLSLFFLPFWIYKVTHLTKYHCNWWSGYKQKNQETVSHDANSEMQALKSSRYYMYILSTQSHWKQTYELHARHRAKCLHEHRAVWSKVDVTLHSNKQNIQPN